MRSFHRLARKNEMKAFIACHHATRRVTFCSIIHKWWFIIPKALWNKR
jgi:hypothetical protein